MILNLNLYTFLIAYQLMVKRRVIMNLLLHFSTVTCVVNMQHQPADTILPLTGAKYMF